MLDRHRCSWLLVQVAGTVLPWFNVSAAVLRGLVVLLVIGFVPALVFAWVFELTPEGLKRGAAVDPGTAKSKAAARSIAVLPFVNMSTDPENEFFSDGLSEEILNSAQREALKTLQLPASSKHEQQRLLTLAERQMLSDDWRGLPGGIDAALKAPGCSASN